MNKPSFKVGDIVVFRGQSDAQRRWGGNDDANILNKGQEYVVEGVAFHSWHTKIRLEHVEGRFNSVCFGLVGSKLK